mmetsp:Transcript_35379/g.93761  ORF Transcript_35379/g.93761 Transcript_35379/m.93761 type:complete len:234 (+) Transcript_35379:50-751(+)
MAAAASRPPGGRTAGPAKGVGPTASTASARRPRIANRALHQARRSYRRISCGSSDSTRASSRRGSCADSICGWSSSLGSSSTSRWPPAPSRATRRRYPTASATSRIITSSTPSAPRKAPTAWSRRAARSPRCSAPRSVWRCSLRPWPTTATTRATIMPGRLRTGRRWLCATMTSPCLRTITRRWACERWRPRRATCSAWCRRSRPASSERRTCTPSCRRTWRGTSAWSTGWKP